MKHKVTTAFFKYKVTTAFFLGVCAEACVLSLLQDWYGRDRYIEMVQKHWISGYITVPIAIFVLIWSVVAYYWLRRTEKNDA